MRDVKGEVIAKRVSEIAAASRHNLLMTRPSGTGRTMIAKRYRYFGHLGSEEIISISVINSILKIALKIALRNHLHLSHL